MGILSSIIQMALIYTESSLEDSNYQRMKVGQRLYHARIDLSRQFNLKSII